MEIMDLMVIIKWFFVWAAVTFVLGGILMLYLKNAEYAAKAAEKQARDEERKGNRDVLLNPNESDGGAFLDTDENGETVDDKDSDTEKWNEGEENSGNKSQDGGD